MKNRTLALCGLAFALLLVAGGAAFAQSGPGEDQNGRLGLPDGASTYSKDVDILYVWIFWVTAGMFVLTEGLLIVFCVIYRRRPGHRPSYTHGNNAAEITWTIVPALMLLTIAIVQIGTWNHIKRDMPSPGKGVTEIQALAQQYQWNFRYPKTKAIVKGDEDVSAAGVMHLPFGDKALVHLRSTDVIHSLFIPEMRVKQDLVPGLRQRLWFEPNRMKLIEIKSGKKHPAGKNMDNSPRELQDWVWVDNPKDLEAGGKYASSVIAVNAASSDGYVLDKDTGLYKPIKNKMRVLQNGALRDGSWGECDYCLGIFEIACAELCGLGHFKMRGQLIVEPRVSFDAWLVDQADAATEAVWKRGLWRE